MGSSKGKEFDRNSFSQLERNNRNRAEARRDKVYAARRTQALVEEQERWKKFDEQSKKEDARWENIRTQQVC